MLRRVLVAASLVCSSSFCMALQPADSCPPANDAAQTKTCEASDPAQAENRAADVPIYEFRFAPAEQAGLPDAPLAEKSRALHGKVYGFRGETLLGAPDVTLRDALPIMQWGGSVGGDLQRSATGYFASFDQFGFSQRKLASFLADLRAQGQLMPLDASPISFTSLASGADHQFNQRDSAYLRFNRDDLKSYALRPAETVNDPSLTTNFGMKQQSVAAGNTETISPSTINETSARFIMGDAQLPAGAPDVSVQSGLPTERHDRVFEAADNVYKQMAGQNLRMGGDFIYNSMNITFIESSLGRNSFFSQSDRGAGFYVNSERRLRPNFVLTSGIRYDVQPMRGFKTDTNNFAPQVGVAWAPSSRTVIRGGVGMFYDQIPLPAIAGSSNPDGIANIQNSGRFVSRNGLPANALAGFTVASPTMQNSYAEQVDLEVEQQIGAKSTLSAEMQSIRGVQLALPMMRRGIAALCESARACQAGNAFSGQEIGTGAISTYRGTTVAYTQEPVRWGNYKVSYTSATAQSAGTGENSAVIGDQMRRASFTGVLHTSLDPGTDAWQHLSRGFVLTGTSDYTDRSEFAGMSFVNFNARLSKTLAWGESYRLQLQAETFNMYQRTNASLTRSMMQMSDRLGANAAVIYNTYQKVASFQSPSGTLVGLHLDF